MKVFCRRLRVLVILASFVAAVPSLHADKEKPKPPADPFDVLGTDRSAAKKPNVFKEAEKILREGKAAAVPRIVVLTEFIEIEQAELTRWLADPENKTDGPALREHVQGLIREGKATIRDMNLVATRSGQRFKNESVDFLIYPAAWDPPKIGTKSGEKVVPAGYASCEARNVGFSTSVDPVLWPDRKLVDLNLGPEITEIVGEMVSGKDESEIRIPKFHTMKTYTQVTVPIGEPGLAGTMVPHAPADPERKTSVVLLFVRADVHQPEK